MNEMTRILHVVPDLIPYGLEKVVASLAKWRDRSRFQVDIVSLYGEAEGSLGQALERTGARVFYLDKRKGLDTRMFKRFGQVLRETAPDVVHTHNYVLRYTLPPSLMQRVPVQVHTIHNVAQREVDFAGRMLQYWAFRGRVHPVAIAEEVVQTFRKVYGLPRPALIPNGIGVEDFSMPSRTRDEWRQREGFESTDLLFVCVARLFAQKNHKTLLEAFASGPASLPNAKLLLAGDGDLQTALEAQACELRIRDKVRFLGRRQDIPAMLAACDVFVLASLWEGNPLSVMEAMAAGRPSVVTSVGGVPELLEDGKHGFAVDAGNSPAFAAAMMQLAQHSSMRRVMGAAASARARERFDHKHMVRAYESLYEKLLPRPVRQGATSGVAA